MAKSVKEVLSDLINLSPTIKKLIIKGFWLIFIFELIKVIPPYVFKELIDKLIKFDPSIPIDIKFILILLGGYFAGLFLMTLLDILCKKILVPILIDSEVDILQRAFKKLLKLDLNYHEVNNTGSSVGKLLRGSGKLVELLWNINDTMTPILLQTAITLGFLIFISWEITLTYLFFVPIFIFILLWGAIRTHKAREEMMMYQEGWAGSIAQSIYNIRTVKDFNNADKEIEKSNRQINRYRDAQKMRHKLGIREIVINDAVINTARIVTLLIAVWLMWNLRITAGELVFIVTMTEKAYINLSRLSRIYYRIQDAEPSIERFKEINDEKIIIKDKESNLNIEKGLIEFNNVYFKYNKNSKNPALNKINFTIEPKQTIALVGRSGSGKSTIIKLLLRHYDTSDGKVKIDGNYIEDYSLQNLRKNIAIVSQDVELFNDTIYENIAYGVDNVSMTEVLNAAKMAYADEFIQKLHKKYKTKIGERGIRLSGGQKQRIAIARALIKKPKIIIFDEATSSLDSESEKKIHEAIFKLIGKQTLILIAHRFSTIEHADKIILLENGSVAEIGTHKELMKKKGIFAKLRKLQELGEVD